MIASSVEPNEMLHFVASHLSLPIARSNVGMPGKNELKICYAPKKCTAVQLNKIQKCSNTKVELISEGYKPTDKIVAQMAYSLPPQSVH